MNRAGRMGTALVLLLFVACSHGSPRAAGPSSTRQPSTVSSPTGASPSPTGPASPAPPPLVHSTAIHVPPGFRAEIYARGLVHPTAMAYGPDGRLYVTEDTGRVVTVRPASATPTTFVGGIPVPLGLAWDGDTLFVSGQGVVESVRLVDAKATGRSTVVSGLPYKEHQQDNVVLGPDGRLYIGSGSTCNVCREADPRSAAVLSVRPDGSDLRVVASGLRNPYGLAFQPGSDRLYATVNGQDYIGTASDPEPADMLVIVREGSRYGWPTCYPSARTLSMVGPDCHGVTPPAAYLEPHSAAGGMAFYTGSSFPDEYRGNLFVAEWGEYLSTEHGRKIVRIRLGPNGTAPISQVSVFARGFQHPLAVAEDPLGALLVADYGRGIIYRIQALGAS